MSLLKWTISSLFLFHCSINLKSVLEGKNLLEALNSSVEIFFERRMENKIKKTIYVGNWEILFEDENYIYYGKGYFSLLSFLGIERINLDELFKVSKKELEQKFPVYKNFDGRILMSKYCSGIYSKTKLEKKEVLKFYKDCKADLNIDGIRIQIKIHTSKRIISQKIELKFSEI
jgi:hypothetical protein